MDDLAMQFNRQDLSIQLSALEQALILLNDNGLLGQIEVAGDYDGETQLLTLNESLKQIQQAVQGDRVLTMTAV